MILDFAVLYVKLDEFIKALFELFVIVVEISILFIEIDDVLILPLISNLFKGFVIPIPKFPLELMINTNWLFW